MTDFVVYDDRWHDSDCSRERPCRSCILNLEDHIRAALAIHAPHCRHCIRPIDQCDGHADWRTSSDFRHDPYPVCTVCVVNWAAEQTDRYPCPTARALGVQR